MRVVAAFGVQHTHLLDLDAKLLNVACFASNFNIANYRETIFFASRPSDRISVQLLPGSVHRGI